MNDKELSTFGEKLYESILETPLPAGTLFGLSTAVRQGAAWEVLPAPLKVAVFKIASRCARETEAAMEVARGERSPSMRTGENNVVELERPAAGPSVSSSTKAPELRSPVPSGATEAEGDEIDEA